MASQTPRDFQVQEIKVFFPVLGSSGAFEAALKSRSPSSGRNMRLSFLRSSDVGEKFEKKKKKNKKKPNDHGKEEDVRFGERADCE